MDKYFKLGSAGFCSLEGILAVFNETSKTHWWAKSKPAIIVTYINEPDEFEFIFKKEIERDNFSAQLKLKLEELSSNEQ